MAYTQPRLRCWFCDADNSNVSLIVSPDKPPDPQFKPFNIDAHERCFQLFIRHGDGQRQQEFCDGHTLTTK